MTLEDQRRIPRPAVLLVQRHQLATSDTLAGRGVRVCEEHQRQQPGHLALIGEERAHQASEPDRLGGQVATDGSVPGPVARYPSLKTR